MTLQTESNSKTFAGNGATQVWPCDFRIFDDTDVVATLVDPDTGDTTVLVLNTDYTISGEGDSAGFTLSTALPVEDGKNLLVERIIPYTQPTDFTNQGAFFPTMHQDMADRLGMQIQQVAGVAGRALQVPNGLIPDPSGVLPVPRALAPLAWNAEGTALENGDWSAADVLLRPDLADSAAGKGADLVSFTQSGTGAVPRTLMDKVRETSRTPQDYGAIGDGTTDDTAAVQDWITACATYGFKGYIPAVDAAYRLTARITALAGINIVGDGCEPYTSSISTIGVRGHGSWFYLDHTDIGFDFYGASSGRSGGSMRNVGTYRNQPTPNGGAFTPNVNDYDIRAYNYDLLVEDVVLLNPTLGITCVAGNYGRLTTNRLRGQPLQVGINVDMAADVCRFDNTHFWVFWSNDAGVRDYMVNNAIGVRLYRCDNPTINGHFSIGYGRHFQINQNANGTTSKLRIVNADGDLGGYFMEVVSAVTGFVGHLSNCCTQGKTSGGPTAFDNIQINGTGCFVSLSNCELKDSLGACLNVSGTTNTVNVSNLTISDWNRGAGGQQGIISASGNTVMLDKFPMIQTKTTTTVPLSSNVSCPGPRGTTAGTTSAAGDLTITHTYGTSNAAPATITVTPRGSTTAISCVTQSISSTQAVIRCFGPSGTALASTSVTLNWSTQYA